MLKSCKYCGRIHDSSIICDQKKKVDKQRKNNREPTAALVFRRSKQWTDKSIAIRKRDKYMCLCCLANICQLSDQYQNQYNVNDISVHHIVPIKEDYSKRFDDENLITVCSAHHEMCESGKISRKKQRELARLSMLACEK